LFALNPVSRKRWQRFRSLRRAWYSLCLLLALYVLSLGAELLCNGRPLLLRHQGRWYFPFCRFYPQSTFTPGGPDTRINYRRLEQDQAFREQGSWMLWAPVANDPLAIVPLEELQGHLRSSCRLRNIPQLGGISVNAELIITRYIGMEAFYPGNAPAGRGRKLTEFWDLPPALLDTLQRRLQQTQAFPAESYHCPGREGHPGVQITLPASAPRAAPPLLLRLTINGLQGPDLPALAWDFEPGAAVPRNQRQSYETLPAELRQLITASRQRLAGGESVLPQEVLFQGRKMLLSCEQESVRFPFRPVAGHWLGLDDAGRDVFARILYGLRSSLSFGLILVICAMTAGTAAGMLQGYLGGWVDILGQRLIEIWSALPFLYIMILMGSIYGPSFQLLIFCYALFNWIGISYYMRAEMLRLRQLPFVEAARCLGLPGWKIALRHILPNSLVPLITFFPFSLVGAIGSLAALDYLGFGLPPPTPSLGQLLQQAQNQRWAWWLILYPSLTLFTVMLLGVFVGEGLRNAFDPRRQSRLQ